MKILQIGPGINASKGGMATVIRSIQHNLFPEKKFEIESFSSYADGGKLKVLVYSVWKFAEFLLTGRASAYDLYHIHVASCGSTIRKAFYARIIKRHRGKIILHIHGGGYMNFYAGLSVKKKRAVVKFLQSADLVIALSDEWKTRFETAFHLTNCVVLPNGVDTDLLSEAQADPLSHANAFLMLSRMSDEKGVYDLLKAALIVKKVLPNLKLYLAGDGELEKIKAEIVNKELESTAFVVGWADDVRKMELLKKVSTVILPSYSEAFPMCILEGMACGKAVISTTVGAVPEIIQKENGILFTPGDIPALANAMLTFATNSDRLAACSQANLLKSRREYSLQKMKSSLAAYYHAVCPDEEREK